MQRESNLAHSKHPDADFGAYVTRANVRCDDGLTISPGAFAKQDGKKVPVVYQHIHDSMDNILGHAFLENRSDGTYGYFYLNNEPQGELSRKLVQHGDLDSVSIWANNLVKHSSKVVDGKIREVSLCLSGANEGAHIEPVTIKHDGFELDSEDEFIIYMGPETEYEFVEHDGMDDGEDGEADEFLSHAMDEEYMKVIESMTEEQQKAMYGLISVALKTNAGEDTSAQHSGTEGGNNMPKGNTDVSTRPFEPKNELRHGLTLEQANTLIHDALEMKSWKAAYLAHATEYGIEDIEFLMPDPKNVTPTPELIARDISWVQAVLNGARKVPFNRVKTLAVDITHDEARAKGYIKGTLKKDEFVKMLTRTTFPKTIYKKQRLDKDDIDDITDFNVVSWLWSEMRRMLQEETARAVLIGDGRAADDPEHIDEDCVRPIYKEDELYATHVTIPAGSDTATIMDEILRARKNYKGSGNPTFFTTIDFMTDCLLLKDLNQHRMYRTKAEVAQALGYNTVVEVEVMENVSRDVTGGTADLVGIGINMRDYTIGSTANGQLATFEDFDIDYNQYKYLIETRLCGAMTKPKAALVFEKLQAAG